MREKFNTLETQMNGKYINRRDEIHGLLVTLLANGNMVLLGKAGTAKTDMVQCLANCIETEAFETILTKTSSPEELWGSYSIKELEKGNFVRNTKNTLAEAHVGFIDEVFKCNSAVLNGLLGIMAQRTFRNGSSSPQPTPLKLLVGASNEMPDGGVDGDLSALWDRFEMRFVTEYIKDERSFAKLLAMTEALEPTVRLTIDEVQNAQKEILAVKVAPVEKTIIGLWKELRKEGYLISDRKWRNCLKYLKANAGLEGRDESTEDDLEILAHMFWQTPEQIKPIRKLVGKFLNPAMYKTQEQYDICMELVAELGEFTDDEAKNREQFNMTSSAKATEVHGKLQRAKKSLQTVQIELKEQGKSTKRIDETIAEVDSMVVNVVTNYLLK